MDTVKSLDDGRGDNKDNHEDCYELAITDDYNDDDLGTLVGACIEAISNCCSVNTSNLSTDPDDDLQYRIQRSR